MRSVPAQGPVTVSNDPGLAIPDDGYIGIDDGNDGTGVDAGMVCAELDFSAQPSSLVVGAEMEIGISHSWLGDITVKLTSPDGSTLPVMVRPAGINSNPTNDTGDATNLGDGSNLDRAAPLTFRDAGETDPEVMGIAINGDAAVCLDDGLCDYFPNPDVAAGHPDYVNVFAGFVGEKADGVWQICVGDGELEDEGTFDTVSLTINGSGFVANEDPTGGIPGTHALSGLHPNPFHARTSFTLAVARSQNVVVSVLNLLGQRVVTLHKGVLPANQERTFTFEAGQFPSGVYIVRVEGEQFLDTRHVTLLK